MAERDGKEAHKRELAATLKQLRVEAGLTQGAAGERLGKSEKWISAHETAINAPRRHALDRLLDLYAAPDETRDRLRALEAYCHRKEPHAGRRPRGVTTLAAERCFGRDDDIAAILAWFAAPGRRLLVLTGIGGIGKTALAGAAAARIGRDHPGRIASVRLDELGRDVPLAATVARQLGIRDSGGKAAEARLIAELDDCALLVVDACEYRADAGTFMVRLLETCPSLKILATSRQHLNLRVGQLHPVARLAVPEDDTANDSDGLARVASVAMLADRIRRVAPDFRLALEESATVVRLCRRLDGIPLAIALVAARCAELPLRAVADELDRRLLDLADGPADLPERQRSLAATLAWTYERLPEAERRLFRRVAICRGCEWGAIEELVAADGSGVSSDEAVAGLVRHGLLLCGQRPGGERRYDMLDVVREYALRLLEQHGEGATSGRWHAGHYERLIRSLAPGLAGPERAPALATLDREYGNIRLLLDRAAAGWPLVAWPEVLASLRRYWVERGLLAEGRRWLDALLDAATGAGYRAPLLIDCGLLAALQGEYDAAERAAVEARRLHGAGGDRVGQASAANLLGIVAVARGDHAGAWRQFARCVAFCRATGDAPGLATALEQLAQVTIDLGEPARARALIDESLRIRRELGDEPGVAASLVGLASVVVLGGDVGRAAALVEEGLAIARRHGAASITMSALHHRGVIATLADEPTLAARCLAEALDLAWRRERTSLVAACLARLADLAAPTRPAHAARLLGAARHLFAAQGMAVPDEDYEDTLQLLRTRLGAGEAARLVAAGRRADLRQIVAEALARAVGIV